MNPVVPVNVWHGVDNLAALRAVSPRIKESASPEPARKLARPTRFPGF
jgi:hypothetical protein